MRILISIFLIVFLAVSCVAQDFYFSNGMTGYLYPQFGTGMVAYVAIVKCGVRTETAETNGISHYLEHLLFNGTKSFSQEELYKTFDNLGIYANAQTGKDYVAFMMIGPIEKKDTIAKLLKEQIFYSTLPVGSFEKEKGIVLQEMARTELDEDYSFENIYNLWDKEGTPYSLPTLGSKSSIGRIQHKEVFDYYHKWFHPNNIVLLVSGDAPKKQFYEVIREVFEDIPASNTQKQEKLNFKKRERNSTHQIIKQNDGPLRFRGRIGPFHPDSLQLVASLEVVLSLFQPSDHIHLKSIQEFDFGSFRDKDGVLLELSGKSNTTMNADTLQKNLLEAFQKFSKTELTNQKIQNYHQKNKWSEARSSEQIQYWGLMQASRLVQGSSEYWSNYDAVKSKLTKDDLIKYFNQVLQSPLGLFIEKTDNSTQSIDEFETITEEVRLQNGIKIVYRKQKGSDLVGVHFLIKDRSMNEPAGKSGITEFLHTIIQNYGPSGISKSQWADTLNATGIVLKCADDPMIPFDDYYTTTSFSFIRYDVPEINFDKSLSIIVNALRNPRIDEISFQEVKTSLLSRVKKESSQPRSVAVQLLNQKLFSDNRVYSAYGSVETIESIQLEDLIQFHKSYINSNNIVITIDGKLPFEVIQQSANQSLLELTTIEKSSKERSNLAQLPTGRFEVSLNKSQSYVIVAGELNLIPDSLFSTFETCVSLLSNSIQMNLREKKGWAYTVGANSRIVNDKIIVTIQIGCKQEVIDSAITEMKEVYSKFLIEPIKFDEFKRTRNAYIGRVRMRESSRQFRAFSISMAILNKKNYLGASISNIDQDVNDFGKIDLVRQLFPNLTSSFIVR